MVEIHIDFVPFITGSKRGLDTRVSLKQALAAQGFRGGAKAYTEWTQWIESEKYKVSGLNQIQTEVLKNGKQTLFALMGVCYRLINADITEKELVNNPKSIATIPFVFGGMISNYHGDDIDKKLDRVIKDLVYIVADAYQNAYNNGQTTSVSNFMKTDQRYYNEIVAKFSQALGMMIGDELKSCIDIFKRV